MEYVIWYASSTSDFLSILSDQFSKRSLFRCCRSPDDPGYPDCAFSAPPRVSATTPSAGLFGRAGPELRNTRHVAGLGSFCIRRRAEEAVGLRPGHGREAAVIPWFSRRKTTNDINDRCFISFRPYLFFDRRGYLSDQAESPAWLWPMRFSIYKKRPRCMLALCDSSIDAYHSGPRNTGGGRKPKFSVCFLLSWVHVPLSSHLISYSSLLSPFLIFFSLFI